MVNDLLMNLQRISSKYLLIDRKTGKRFSENGESGLLICMHQFFDYVPLPDSCSRRQNCRFICASGLEETFIVKSVCQSGCNGRPHSF